MFVTRPRYEPPGDKSRPIFQLKITVSTRSLNRTPMSNLASWALSIDVIVIAGQSWSNAFVKHSMDINPSLSYQLCWTGNSAQRIALPDELSILIEGNSSCVAL
jgi:hypothetical protein